MKKVLIVLVLFCVALCGPTHATSEYTYKKGEYVTIRHGMAPNRHYSLATHGDGEGGYENFHVYLMREPGHKKIGPLTEIDEILNTAADRYEAAWSPDSRYVAIIYNQARYILTMKLYRVEQGRAFPVRGFDLEQALLNKEGLHHHPFEQEKQEDIGWHWRLGYFEIKWQNNVRFVLTQEEFYLVPTPLPAKPLGAFARARRLTHGITDYSVTLAVEAICELHGSSDKVQIVSLTPGPFVLDTP